MLPLSLSPKFQSTLLHCRVRRHFETNAPNDSQMTLNITRSNVPHMCVTSVPEFQILARFTLRQVFSSYMPDWDNQVYRMTQNDPEHNKAKCTTYMCYWNPRVPNISLLCSRNFSSSFSTATHRVRRHFETNAPNGLKMTFNSQRLNIHHICISLLVSTSPKF